MMSNSKDKLRKAKKSDTIDQVIDSMRDNPSVTVHRGANIREIRRIMGLLNVKFPKNFVVFLQQVGWVAFFDGDVVFGCGPDIPDIESLGNMTKRARRARLIESLEWRNIWASTEDQVPPWYIVIAEDGAGNYECLDTTRIRGHDCPVVFWDHDYPGPPERQKPHVVAKKFANWLRRKLEECPGT